MRQVVYLDEIILVNLVMNFTVLWLTSRLNVTPAGSPVRLLSAAAIGCLYALAIFVPGFNLAGSFWAKLLTAALMVLIAFGYTSWQKFMRNFLWFILIGFTVGGIAAGLHYLGQNITVVQFKGPLADMSYHKWLILTCTVLCCLGAGKWGIDSRLRQLHLKAVKIPLTVTLWGKSVSLEALVDTGNRLMEPLSRHPVVIVEYEVLQPLLPAEICGLFQSGKTKDGSHMMLSLAQTSYAKRLRLIPFHAVGSEHGMLLGIQPDNIEIFYQDKQQRVKDVVVGIYDQRLSPETAYRALLHPQLLAS
ncbi:sigma-E processing peptidase SpoIIGA [Desulforamulus hydrothermalis]|uniref:Sporulation sigma-E factor-processing peptidase n=1 Tax=Desulforamulus hydrothermalis Lam5 = DSM 18033 TaxID=1121428 RepID=K8EJI5_9FIRM|nr:sigma-E processing peptidase SpoIIGA [Desulforamulus hydrothermalis]CCO08736.1 Peptidase U4 sporulation factor SpoIIGA [Desulforamulus hydrothermalis Lam5 = DSM 18033]SHG70303.1 stage II sporulation protein GA (sporulation sigma-E factor processing peptidase) [Desulforamulus hydrothermalis Lam5 = DSM 18033]